jgi:hypothetical protein
MPPKKNKAYNQGANVAASLLREMHFLGKIKKNKKTLQLVEIQARSALSFQIINKNVAPRDKAVAVLGLTLPYLHFCIADGSIESIHKFDVDHAVAFEAIHQKQEYLLNHLNANQQFAEGFLGYDEEFNGNKISDYFGRDKATNLIKGTRLFFKLCYNDIDNLLLLCHSCNKRKSCKETLAWFEKCEPYLGKSFIKSVKEDGGLHEGIIVKKICKVTNRKTVNIGGIDCLLHEGSGHGLGTYVSTWFTKKHKNYANRMVISYSKIWGRYQDLNKPILIAENAGNHQLAQKTCAVNVKLSELLSAMIETIKSKFSRYFETQLTVSQASSSASDDSATLRERVTGFNNTLLKEWKFMHEMKKIIALIAKYDASLLTKENKEAFYRIMRKANISSSDMYTQDMFFKSLAQLIEQKYSITTVKKPSNDDLLQDIEKLSSEFSFAKLKERLDASEAKAKNETERANAEKERANAEKERADAETERADAETERANAEALAKAKAIERSKQLEHELEMLKNKPAKRARKKSPKP